MMVVRAQNKELWASPWSKATLDSTRLVCSSGETLEMAVYEDAGQCDLSRKLLLVRKRRHHYMRSNVTAISKPPSLRAYLIPHVPRKTETRVAREIQTHKSLGGSTRVPTSTGPPTSAIRIRTVSANQGRFRVDGEIRHTLPQNRCPSLRSNLFQLTQPPERMDPRPLDRPTGRTGAEGMLLHSNGGKSYLRVGSMWRNPVVTRGCIPPAAHRKSLRGSADSTDITIDKVFAIQNLLGCNP